MTNGLHIHIYIPVITCKKIYSFSGFFVDVGAFPRSWKTLGVAQYFGVWPKNWELGQYFGSLPKVLGVWPILAAIKLMQFWKMRESDYEKCF